MRNSTDSDSCSRFSIESRLPLAEGEGWSSSDGCVRLGLGPIELVKNFAPLDQLTPSSALDDAATLEYENEIRVSDRG